MKHIRLAIIVGVILALSACGPMPFLPKPSITPIDIETTVADEVHVEDDEDNLAKLEVSENHETRNEIVAEQVSQVQNHIQEYPVWLVIAFAVAVGLALPSPFSLLASRRVRRAKDAEIERLTDLLEASTGSRAENMPVGDWQSVT